MGHKRSYGVKDTIQTVLVSWNKKKIERKDLFLRIKILF